MEQIGLEVQRALAMVQDYGAFGLVEFRARLIPLDEKGEPIILLGENGEPVEEINIPPKPPEQPYRNNEPGLEVLLLSEPKHGSRPRRTIPSGTNRP